jgi:NADPH:quinone reductase-like Zn-dependent oxidoreductase
MLAIRVHRFGGPEELVLEETSMPVPSVGEALIRVCAAGVGNWDALVRSGRSGLPQALPLTPGACIAGVLEQIGPGSAPTSLKPTDAVYGMTNPSFTGGYAQYALAMLDSIARKPASTSFVDAASVPVVAVTAWQMLFDRADLRAGQTVLVQGAAGNVGAYAVQLARWAGARVIAVAGAADAQHLLDLGAAEVIDFRTQRFEDHVAGVDVVIDTVGAATQAQSFAAIKRGGILVSSVSEPSTALAAQYGVRTAYFIVAVSAAQLERIAQLLHDRTLRTDLGVVLALADARKAHEMLGGTIPHPRGKIVLDVNMLQEGTS